MSRGMIHYESRREGMIMATLELTARQDLQRAAASRRLTERQLYRAIFHAVQDGLTQRQISDIVGSLSQASVQRLIQRVAADPELMRETPAEIVDRRAAGLIDDELMMSALMKWTYSTGYVPSINGVSTDAYITGDWDDIELAYYRELLSDKEFHQLAERQLELVERAVPSR
jgi:hypothetical protein